MPGFLGNTVGKIANFKEDFDPIEAASLRALLGLIGQGQQQQPQGGLRQQPYQGFQPTTQTLQAQQPGGDPRLQQLLGQTVPR